jgi:hypothetical protein
MTPRVTRAWPITRITTPMPGTTWPGTTPTLGHDAHAGHDKHAGHCRTTSGRQNVLGQLAAEAPPRRLRLQVLQTHNRLR